MEASLWGRHLMLTQAVLLWVAAAGVLGAGLSEALDANDECQSGNGREVCGLSLRQLRGEPTAGKEGMMQSSAFSLMQAKVSAPEKRMLQFTRQHDGCGESPQLDGEDLGGLITNSKGVLLVAMRSMRCTEAVETALRAQGVAYTLKEFHGEFVYTHGQSSVWDWLHCKYPHDRQGGTIMHSYMFNDGKFVGQGFAAASLVESGRLAGGGQADQSCTERFPQEAQVVSHYMSNATTRVLFFGWISCPCVGIAQTRFAASSLCYEGRQWADPNSRLMSYLQCRENDPQSHSFAYFRSSTDADSEWTFIGNGFAFEESAMTSDVLSGRIQAAGASTSCKRANVKTNLYGTQLEECRVGEDPDGSWMDDGTCSEQTGGIHQICIEALPADFSSETHQPPWSKERAGKRHCVCVGAWSLYMTDADKHQAGAETIMPHCHSIPETVLTVDYLGHWRQWNGYPASVLNGIQQLVSRCFEQAETKALKCGLKERFTKLRASHGAKELKKAAEELKTLSDSFGDLSC